MNVRTARRHHAARGCSAVLIGPAAASTVKPLVRSFGRRTLHHSPTAGSNAMNQSGTSTYPDQRGASGIRQSNHPIFTPSATGVEEADTPGVIALAGADHPTNRVPAAVAMRHDRPLRCG